MTLPRVPPYEPDRATERPGRAIVVGASMAGLLAARVLADHYERVLVIERDTLPPEPTVRPGVPQARHAHVLTEAGRATLEALFPGFGDALRRSGALTIDVGSDFDFYDGGGLIAKIPDQQLMFTASRPLFEWVTREQLSSTPGIELRDETQQLSYNHEDGAVTGVRVRTDAGETADLPADLVVDATGRTSRTPAWLEASGYGRPDTDEVHVDLAYSSLSFDRPAGRRTAAFVMPGTARPRGAGVFPIEDERFLLTFSGVHGDHPPTDLEGLRRFAAGLPIPLFEDLLAEHAPADVTIDHYPFPSTRRHRYEDLGRFPDRLLVVGDAVASFNPLYGQGMSVGALEALVLHRLVAEADGPVDPRRFFERIAPVVDDAWRLAVSGDFRFPETTGPKPLGTDLLNRYVARLTRRAHDDAELAHAYVKVIMMERRPTSLFRPGVLRRVLGPQVGPRQRG